MQREQRVRAAGGRWGGRVAASEHDPCRAAFSPATRRSVSLPWPSVRPPQGTISFPIFVLHGALGQLFYKKIIATKVRSTLRSPYCAVPPPVPLCGAGVGRHDAPHTPSCTCIACSAPVVPEPPPVAPTPVLWTQVWGGVMPQSFFPAYCAIVLVSAAAMQKFFLVRVKLGRRWGASWGAAGMKLA